MTAGIPRIVAGLLALLIGNATPASSAPPVTTTNSSSAYVYDAPSAARVDVRQLGATDARPAQVRDVRERSAAPSVDVPGPSTTPYARSVATNTADDVLRLGTKDSWGNLNTLDDHFARHGADFGATSVDDYARQASEFLQQPGTLTKIDADGVIRVYDPATNTFGAYNPNGTTRTFFTPKRGIDYWNDQPGVAP